METETEIKSLKVQAFDLLRSLEFHNLSAKAITEQINAITKKITALEATATANAKQNAQDRKAE
jgi:hypothetical protein